MTLVLEDVHSELVQYPPLNFGTAITIGNSHRNIECPLITGLISSDEDSRGKAVEPQNCPQTVQSSSALWTVLRLADGSPRYVLESTFMLYHFDDHH
jgi:hypothetical protein